MATYAAYRHIELDNIGYGKKRVLKPPGGGTSDIFGSNEPPSSAAEPRSRPARPLHSSSLFMGEEDGASSGAAKSQKPGNDSYQRLFGEIEIPSTPAKSYMKSNIVLDISEIDCPSTKSMDSNGNNSLTPSQGSTPENGNSPRDMSGKVLKSPRNPVTGDGYDGVPYRSSVCCSARRRDGNPVTGEGYDNQSKPSTPMVNGNSNGPAPPTPTSSAPRQRVPPGGFSSGLW